MILFLNVSYPDYIFFSKVSHLDLFGRAKV
jgi:hypothetical protein